jgi:uncharacterized lipoprotein NlpE involved in copper resistance
MKKSIISILALLALTLTGCENPKANAQQQQCIIESSGAPEYLEAVKFRGHSYIVYKGYERGGITHDPDCPCREKGESDK